MRCRSLRLLAFPFCLVLAASAQNSPVLGGCAGPALGSFGAYSVTAFGSGFAPGDTLQWNRSTVTTAFASSTQLNAAIPAGMVMPADSYLLTESSSGVLSNCVLVAIQPPPAIASVAPGQVDAGGQSFAATLFGTGFVAGSQVLAEGQPLSTAFIGPGQLNFSIPAASLASSGKYVLTVANPSGAVSNALVFYIQPVLASISPTLGVAGNSGLTITATGTGFVPGDILVLNRAGVFQTLPTTYLGPTGLSAIIPATALQPAGQAMIFVSDGDLSSGIASRSLAFRVGNAPMIGALSANTRVAGGSDFTLSISGDGFLPGAAVQWNAAGSTTPLSTTFNGAVQLTAAVPAQMTAAPGAATITVANPAGAVSNAMSFTVTPPGLAISNLAPGSAVAGGPAFALIVSGSGFASGATVLWNGKALPTAVAGDSQATAAVSAALIASSGTAAIAVTTSAGVSNPLAFPIAPPIPVVSTNGIVNALSSLPSIAPGSLISIWGTNLAPAAATPDPPALVANSIGGTSVTINGFAAPLLYVSPTLINAQLPFEVGPGAAARLVVEVDGAKSAPALFPVTATAPGVSFLSTNSSPNHALAVNYADGTLNAPDHPAAPGQYVILYLTGQGALCTPLSTGYPAPPAPFLYPTADVQASIGGAAAQVPFAGLVPGWVGILQMNLLVPNAPSGEQPLEIAIGGVSANPTTLSIQSP
jgi:uncharacterized protein (TIGR03437 family)